MKERVRWGGGSVVRGGCGRRKIAGWKLDGYALRERRDEVGIVDGEERRSGEIEGWCLLGEGVIIRRV